MQDIQQAPKNSRNLHPPLCIPPIPFSAGQNCKVSSPPPSTDRTNSNSNIEPITPILKSINCGAYQQAYRQSLELKIPALFGIIRNCYEHSLLRNIISSNEKVIQVVSQEYLLPEKGSEYMKALLDMKELCRKQAAFFEAITESLLQISKGTFSDSRFSTPNDELKRLKNALQTVNRELKMKKENKVYIRQMVKNQDYVETTLARLLNIQKTKNIDISYYLQKIQELIHKLTHQNVVSSERTTDTSKKIKQEENGSILKERKRLNLKLNQAKLRLVDSLKLLGPLEENIQVSFQQISLQEITDQIIIKFREKIQEYQNQIQFIHQKLQASEKCRKKQQIIRFELQKKHKINLQEQKRKIDQNYSSKLKKIKEDQFFKFHAKDSLIKQKQKQLEAYRQQLQQLKNQIIQEKMRSQNEVKELKGMNSALQMQNLGMQSKIHQNMQINKEQQKDEEDEQFWLQQRQELYQKISQLSSSLQKQKQKMKELEDKYEIKFKEYGDKFEEIRKNYEHIIESKRQQSQKTIEQMSEQIKAFRQVIENFQFQSQSNERKLYQMEIKVKDLLKEREQIQNHCHQMTEDLQKVQNEFESLKSQYDSIYESKKILGDELQMEKEQRQFLEKEVKSLKEVIQEFQASINLLTSEIERLKNPTSRKQSQNLQILKKSQSQNSLKSRDLIKMEQREHEIKQLRDEIANQIQNQNMLNEFIEELRLQVNSLHQQKVQADSKTIEITQKLQQKEYIIQQITSILQQKETQIQKLTTQLEDLNDKIIKFRRQLEQMDENKIMSPIEENIEEFYSNSMETQNIQKDKQFCQIQTILGMEQIEKILENVGRTTISIETQTILGMQQIENILKEKQSLIASFDSMKSAIQIKEKQYDEIVAKYHHLIQKVDLKDLKSMDAFLCGDLFEEDHLSKQFIFNSIQEKMRKSIRKSRLLFKWDKQSRVNFHKYFDNLEDIVLVIKTEAGFILGGYSEGPFYPKMVSNRQGLIFSVTNRKLFSLVERNRRAITYDDYYIIFGNSQIRVKSLEKKVFSNFGITNSYYSAEGHKVGTLLGQGDSRETFFEHMEIHQLFFF